MPTDQRKVLQEELESLRIKRRLLSREIDQLDTQIIEIKLWLERDVKKE